MNVFMAPPRTYLFPICQGGPGPLCYIVTKKVVQHYRNTQFCIIGDGSPTILEQPTARTKIDQSQPYLGRLMNRPSTHFEESTDPTFCLHSPQGAGHLVSSMLFHGFPPRTNIFPLCLKIWLKKCQQRIFGRWPVEGSGDYWRGASSPQFVNAKLIIWTPPQQPIKASQNTNRKVCKCQMIISFSSSASKSFKLPVFLNVPLL